MKKQNSFKTKRATFKKLYMLPRKYDLILLLSCLALSLIGIVYIGSASMSTMFNNLSEITSSQQALSVMMKAIFKQSLFLVVSYIAMCFVANIFQWESFRFPLSLDHFSKLTDEAKKNYKSLPIIVLVIFVALFVCLLFPARNGTYAWISIPGIGTIQPSEFAKVAIILLVAGTLCEVRKKYAPASLVKPIAIVALAYFITIWRFQNDFGSAAVLLVVAGICFLIPSDERLSGIQKYLSGFVILGILAGLFFLSDWGLNILGHLPFLSQYQVNRFFVAVDPFLDRLGAGFQVSNSLIAFARGGLFGSGLGASIQKFGYLPFADSDFIIAVIAEEGGLFWLSIVFFLYGTILYRLLKYAIKVKKDQNKVILCGTAAYLFVHFLLNVGGATAFIPLTGVPLLMLSSGGSSLLSWYIAVGLSQSVIARYRRGEE